MFRSLLVGLACAIVVPAQQPPVANAKLRTAAADTGLVNAIRSAIGSEAGPFWIGYSVPIISGERQACCWGEDGRGCGLEGVRRISAPVSPPSRPVQLEGPT